MIVITKSASFPFISWLLEAMRAPTPVSSLVHSSTLVAAGVWFLVRYGFLASSEIMFVLFVLSIFTIFVTGLCAVYFLDLKKIVALSTCNNISWCVLFYACGDEYMVLFQLIVHGVSKCLLFILVGDLMSVSSGSQSAVGLYLPRYIGVVYCSLIVVLVLGLCGLPFLGIYFSKHCFFTLLSGNIQNAFVYIQILLGFCLSYIYSFRLVLVVSSKVRGLSNGYVVSFLFGLFFVVVSSFISVYLGGWDVELIELSVGWSVVFLLVQVLGCFIGWLFFELNFSGWFWESVLCGNDMLIGLFYSLYSFLLGFSLISLYRYEVWFLNYIKGGVIKFQSMRLQLLSINVIVIGILFFIVLSFIISV